VPEKHKEQPDEVAMIAALGEWEQRLMGLVPQKADQEYGRVQEALRQIGTRLAHRVVAANQNRCSSCKKPLPGRGPVDTIPRPAPELPQGWVNQYACSTQCADKLKAEMHDREFKRLSAA
jgi:hypothetical protein